MSKTPFAVLDSKWPTNMSINYKGLSLYVRKSSRFEDGELVKCFDIASATARRKGRGAFTNFLIECIETIHPRGYGLYLECIQNPKLLEFYRKIGAPEPIGYKGAPSILIPNEKLPSVLEGLKQRFQ